MFKGPEYPVSLGEDQFDEWLTKGRESKIRYEYIFALVGVVTNKSTSFPPN